MDITKNLGLSIPSRKDLFNLSLYNNNFKKIDNAFENYNAGEGGGEVPIISPRKAKTTIGVADWWILGDSVDNLRLCSIDTIYQRLEIFKKLGIEELSLLVYYTYGKDITEGATESDWYVISKKETLDLVCTKCEELGIRISSLKFMKHSITKSFLTDNMTTFEPFINKIIGEFCTMFNANNHIAPDVVVVLNELENIYLDNKYKDFILKLLSVPKKFNYNASISTSYFVDIYKMDKDIQDALSVICSNSYPYGSRDGSETTVKHQKAVWDIIVSQIKGLKKKYPNKKIFITETGCEDYWEALANPAAYHYSTSGCIKTEGAAPALFLKAFLESEMIEYVDSVIYWWGASLHANGEPYENVSNILKDYLGGDYHGV